MSAGLTIKEIWVWASASQLLSTVITLWVGSWCLYKWQTKHNFKYELVSCVVKDVTAYADAAIAYWGSFIDGDVQARRLNADKVKSGLPYLSELIDNMDVFKEKRNVHAVIGILYDIATGGPFETADEQQRRMANYQIDQIYLQLAIVKRTIYCEAVK